MIDATRFFQDPARLKESMEMLHKVMGLGIDGFGPLAGAKALGDQYLRDSSYKTKLERIDAIERWEEAKNFTSGFVSSLGGMFTLPLAIPASLGINWILQTRMVAAMAYVAGFDIQDPAVRMTIALSILGSQGKEILNANAAELALLMKRRSFTQIPKRTILLVNQAVAQKLVQLATAKGFSRLSKAIPLVGGLVGGALDLHSARDTARFARELFRFELGEPVFEEEA